MFRISLSLLICTCSFAAENALSPEQIERVDAIFGRWDNDDTPGCALGIVKDGELVYARGYGMADLEHDIPITPTSVFRTASVSKQFTAMCIALAAVDGDIDLDAPIQTYVPELPDFGARVTTRHLVHHTSGMRDYLVIATLKRYREHDWYTPEETLEWLTRQRELNFPPGSDYLYSNSGYFLMGVILERATGKSLAEFARLRIFEPLGMSQSHFHDDHTMVTPQRAMGYSQQGRGKFRINMTPLDHVGDGGVFTTIEDLYKWDQAFEANALGEDVMQLALTPATLTSGDPITYAFGLQVSEYRGLKTVSHGGAFVGFRAQTIRFPDEELSVYVLFNFANVNPGPLARKVAAVFLEERMEPVSEDAGEEEPATVKLAHEVLDGLEGTYSSDELVLTVARSGSRLRVTGGTVGGSYLPTDASTFARRGGGPNLRFGDGGRLIVFGTGEERVLARTATYRPAAGELAGFAGVYYSPELDVTYGVTLEEDSLMLTRRHATDARLQPRVQDRFEVSGMTLRFERRGDTVSGFRLDYGRVRNLIFERRGLPALH